jgi:hypothetical protein
MKLPVFSTADNIVSPFTSFLTDTPAHVKSRRAKNFVSISGTKWPRNAFLSQIPGQRGRFVSKNGTKQKTATPCRASGLRMLPNYFSGVWPILLIGRGGVEK